MSVQNLIIYKFSSLYHIFEELGLDLNFKVTFVENENSLNEKVKNLNNYLIISDKKYPNIINQFVLDKKPIKIFKLVEKINIEFLKKHYSNQSEVKMYDVDWGVNFSNKSSTYEFSSIFNYQKVEKEESGGLISYEKGLYDDPLLYPVYLIAAQSFIKKRKFKIKHSYNFNQNWELIHSWERNKNYQLFNDEELNLDFYNQVLVDSSQTNDSIYQAYSKHYFGLKHNSFKLNYIALQEKYGNIYLDTARFFHGIELVFNKQKLKFQFQFLNNKQHYFQLTYEGDRLDFLLESNNIPPSLYQTIYHSN